MGIKFQKKPPALTNSASAKRGISSFPSHERPCSRDGVSQTLSQVATFFPSSTRISQHCMNCPTTVSQHYIISRNLVKICVVVMRSGHNFAHAMTALLSWLVQNYDLIALLGSKLKQTEFSWDFNYEVMKCLWNELQITWSLCVWHLTLWTIYQIHTIKKFYVKIFYLD